MICQATCENQKTSNQRPFLTSFQPATATSTLGGVASTWNSTDSLDASQGAYASTADTRPLADTVTSAKRVSTGTLRSSSATEGSVCVSISHWNNLEVKQEMKEGHRQKKGVTFKIQRDCQFRGPKMDRSIQSTPLMTWKRGF